MPRKTDSRWVGALPKISMAGMWGWPLNQTVRRTRAAFKSRLFGMLVWFPCGRRRAGSLSLRAGLDNTGSRSHGGPTKHGI